MIYLMCPCTSNMACKYLFLLKKNLHLCSSRILICIFYLVSSWSFSCKAVLMIFWISLISVVMVHFLFLILLIWVFSFFWFIHSSFANLTYFVQEPALCFFDSLYCFCFHSINSRPARLLSTHRLWVWLAHIFTRLQGTLLFIWHHSNCFKAAIKLPFSTAFIASCIICFVSVVLIIELRAPGIAGNQPTTGLWSQFLAIFLNRKTDLL